MRKTEQQKGFSLLYVALLISAITTTFSFVVSTASLDSIRVTELVNSRFAFANSVTTCTERALMEVRNAPEANINGTSNYEGSTCTFSVSGTVPNKSVTVTTTRDGQINERVFIISQTTPTIEFAN